MAIRSAGFIISHSFVPKGDSSHGRMRVFPKRVISFWLPYGHPGCDGVKKLHTFELIQRLGSEVPLIYDAVVADNERSHSGNSVLSGRGYESETTDHDTFDHEVHCAKWRG